MMDQVSEDLFRPPRTFAGLNGHYASFDKAKVVVIPVPYDSTTEYKAGARDGPQAIIDTSQYLELYDHELDYNISEVGIHTLPEVQPLVNNPESMINRVDQIISGILDKGKLPVLLGGEHSITIGAVRALKGRYKDLSVLQMDAHTDLRNEYMGSKYSHACVMRRISEICPFVQTGIRSLSKDEYDFIRDHDLKTFFMEDLVHPNAVNNIISNLSSHVYVTIDLDVLDPSIMSTVGTPEPGGLDWYNTINLIKSVASVKHIVGFDIVELCPNQILTSCSFLAAKLTYKLIGYITAPDKKRKQ